MRTYSKFVVVVGAIAALAVPTVAMADPATNPSTNDAVANHAIAAYTTNPTLPNSNA